MRVTVKLFGSLRESCGEKELALDLAEGAQVVELQELLDQVQNEDKPKLVIDFGHANYFGSIIISAVNQLATTVADGGGKTVICEVSDEMQQVLRVMNLETLWERQPTRREAIKSVTG